MANETNKPGFAYKDDTTTNDSIDNHLDLKSRATALKIVNDGINDLDFALNRGDDTTSIDGVVVAGKELELQGINEGFGSISLKSSVGGAHTAYRLWAYR